MKQYYTDKKYKELLSHMVVLVDSREQSNKNVTDWFDRNNIKWKSRALKTGDYTLNKILEQLNEKSVYGVRIVKVKSDKSFVERLKMMFE